MKSRKAIELSVNFIVTFILAIVVFGMGIIFARNIMGGGTELTQQTYDKFDQQIGELTCSRGESICLSSSTKDIERGKIDAFPVTIKNDLKDKTTFKMAVTTSRAYNNDNSEMDPPLTDWNIDFMYDDSEFSLDPGESRTIPVLVSPKKKALTGKYSYNVVFSYQDAALSVWHHYPDEKINKFYVNVK
ncbi:MAG: hypothetical protein NT001_07745 [Candidatus Woesearchaeota archaeon]|nr:hypothetical protein [Candidatus Woesearchaeota archaeon]